MANFSKPGMMKYAQQFGPYDDEPLAVRVKFWAEQLAKETRHLHNAKAANDDRLIRMARRNIKEANEKLAACGVEKGQQVAA